MVARIVTGKSIRGMLHYNENKVEQKEARLILASGFATDIAHLNLEQKLRRFEHRIILNTAVKTNAVHISLNFDPADRLDDRKLQQIAAEYMERIGFGEQPFLVYRHTDAAHSHVHIATTNIQADGSRIELHNIGRLKSEPVREDIEQKYHLVVAKGRKSSNELRIRPANIERAIYGKHQTKRAITNIVNAVADTYLFTSVPEFNAILKQYNVTADRGSEDTEMFKKKGLIYSLLDQNGNKTGIPIKASAIYRKPTLAALEKQFEKNHEKKKPYKEPLKKTIDRVFSKYEHLTRETFISELAKENIQAVFRTAQNGQVFGITYVDQRNKTVFNGIDLGKSYSGKAITQQLATTDKLLKPEMKQYLKPEKSKVYLKTPRPDTVYLKTSESSDLLKGLLRTGPDYAPAMPRRKKRRRRIDPPNQGLTF